MPQSAKQRLMLSVVFDFCLWISVCVVFDFNRNICVYRVCGVPREARDGLCPAERGCPSGVRSGSPRPGSVHLCAAGPNADQHGLS